MKMEINQVCDDQINLIVYLESCVRLVLSILIAEANSQVYRKISAPVAL